MSSAVIAALKWITALLTFLASLAPVPVPDWDGSFSGCQSLYSDQVCDELWDIRVNADYGSEIFEDGSWVRFMPDGTVRDSGCVRGAACG